MNSKYESAQDGDAIDSLSDQSIAEVMKELPIEAAAAIAWVVENMARLERIVIMEPISPTMLRKYRKEAIEEKDYLLLAILEYCNIVNNSPVDETTIDGA